MHLKNIRMNFIRVLKYGQISISPISRGPKNIFNSLKYNLHVNSTMVLVRTIDICDFFFKFDLFFFSQTLNFEEFNSNIDI